MLIRGSVSVLFSGGERAVHERLLFFHTCLIGQQVEVQTRSGHVYSGIFSSVSPEKEEFGKACPSISVTPTCSIIQEFGCRSLWLPLLDDV